MKLYVAGPMTGIRNKNMPAFARATKKLRKCGFEVINPGELDKYFPESTWEACLKRDIKELVTCDGVATLEGYTTSRGARLETYIALALSMPVLPVSSYLPKKERVK